MAPSSPRPGAVIAGAFVLDGPVPAEHPDRAPWRARRLAGLGPVAVRLIALGSGSEALRVVDRAMVASGEYHPNIPPLLDCGVLPSGDAFFVYDVDPVETLGAALARERLTVGETLRLAEALLAAIESVHFRGDLHCGIDADAVLLGSAQGTVTRAGAGLNGFSPHLLDLGATDPCGRSAYDDICALARLLLEMPAAPLPDPFSRLLGRALGPASTGWSSAAEMRAALRALAVPA